VKRDKKYKEVYLIPKNESKYVECIGCEKMKYYNTRINYNTLPNEHIEIINLMRPGDKLIFDNIVIRNHDGSDNNIGTLTITIK
jgi:hypothetical protein